MASTRVTTQPTTEFITLVQAKNYLRLDQTADDDYVGDIIKRARHQCELMTGYALYTQTLLSVVETDPYQFGPFSGIHSTQLRITLPYAPVQSIAHLFYESDSNVWTEQVDLTVFNIDYDDLPCSIILGTGQRLDAKMTPEGVFRFKVAYVAGFTAVEGAPPNIIQAMYMYLNVYYSNRDNAAEEATACNLLMQERIWQ